MKSHLRVLQNGKELKEIILARGREYIIGRAPECDIVLTKSSVSRQHLKLFYSGNKWIVEQLSRSAALTQDGSDITSVELSSGSTFSIEEYDFRFEEVEEKKVEATYIHKDGDNITPDGANPPSELDRTNVAPLEISATLRILDPKKGEELLITLEGHRWLAGRSSSCQIRIEDSASSRNQFEIIKTMSGYEITDLGSSNGTKLNGKKLKSKIPTPLSSGDKISVGNTQAEFELRDPNYENLLKEIPEHLKSDLPMELELVEGQDPSGLFPAASSKKVIKVIPLKRNKNKKRNIQITIGVLLLIIIYVGLSDNKTETQSNSSVTDPLSSTPGPKLDKKQMELIEDTYKLAKNYYVQGKYKSALSEVQKIHDLIPSYKDSKEMETYCKQAIDIKTQQQDLERRAEQAEEIKKKVKATVTACARSSKALSSTEALQECLSTATELDPENPDIQALVSKVAQLENLRQQNQISKEQRDAGIRQGLAMYNRAKSMENDKVLDAIAEYKRFIASSLPDPQHNKEKAKASVEALNTKMRTDIQKYLTSADEFNKKENYKEALGLLKKAIELDPNEKNVRTAFDTIQDNLNKKLKSEYGDSVIEENLGNIEAAKKKWKIIKEEDVENGEYYLKCISKLNKYGK